MAKTKEPINFDRNEIQSLLAFLSYRTDKYEPMDLKWSFKSDKLIEDYLKIKELALKDKQIKEIAKWSEEKIKETYIKISDEYKDCDFTNNWLKK